MTIYKSLRDARDKFISECEALLSEDQEMVEEIEAQEDLLESNQGKLDELQLEISILEDAIEAAEALS